MRSVVALNPWLYPSDGADLSGRDVLVVHGSADRIADPDTSASVARRLARTANVRYVQVRDGKHAMLRRHTTFDSLAADFTADALLRSRTRLPDQPRSEWRQV